MVLLKFRLIVFCKMTGLGEGLVALNSLLNVNKGNRT